MISAQDIYDIQKLDPEEQNVVFSLVKSFLLSKENKNEAQQFLANTRILREILNIILWKNSELCYGN